MLRSLADLKNDRWGLKVVLHTCICLFVFFVSSNLPAIPFDLLFDITGIEFPLFELITESLLKIAIFVSFAFLYIRKFLKLPLGDFRIRRPKNIIVWLICAITLPFLLSLFFTLFTPGRFAASELNGEDALWTVVCAVFHYGLAAAIMEEVLFRGIIMRIAETRWGKTVAVIAPSVLFALIHLIRMEAFNVTDIFMLTIAGTCVGVMFSLIAIQSCSVWASAAVHGVWNLVIIGGVLEISVNPYDTSIFTYTLTSESVLMTGGAFGIESSLPAIVGYAAVILLILIKNRLAHFGYKTPE